MGRTKYYQYVTDNQSFRKMAITNSFSVYLINKGYSSFDEIINSFDNKIDIEEGVLFLKSTKDEHSIPSWVKIFFKEEPDDEIKKALSVKTLSAVYLTSLTIDDKIVTFALSFGYGRHLIKNEYIQRDFGLDTSKHAIEVEKIKSVSTLTFDSSIKVKTIDSVNEIKDSEFFLNQDTDVLKMINGRVRRMTGSALISERMIGGKDSVNMTAKVDLGNLNQFLEQLYRQYQDNGENGVQYKSSIIQVKDKKTITKVETLLMEALKDDEKKKHITVSLPLVEKPSNPPYNNYKVGDIEYLELSADILTSLGDIRIIRSAQLFAIPIDTSKEAERYDLYKCVYSEFDEGDKCFIIFEGDIYEIEKSFKQKVEYCFSSMFDSKDIDNLPNLKDWKMSDKEEDYNENQQSDDMLVMDKKFVFPTGRSKFEVCDLLSKSKYLIHVKIYNGASAPLGHLFSQGLISAQCIIDDSIRIKINELISSVQESEMESGGLKHGADFRLDEPFAAENYTVVFVILCRPENCLDVNGMPKIPFFAKAVFKDVYDSLSRLKFNVKVLAKQGVIPSMDVSNNAN